MARSHPTATSNARILLAVLAMVLAGALLAACGGSSPDPSATNAASKEQQAETQLDNYARCMREHGFDAEVATMPGGGRGLKIRPGKGLNPATAETAEKGCAHFRPPQQPVNLSPQQKVEQEEAVQRFAKCMREHGIDVEASTKGGGIRIQLQGHPGSGGPNPESPSFQHAQAACQKLLPRGPR